MAVRIHNCEGVIRLKISLKTAIDRRKIFLSIIWPLDRSPHTTNLLEQNIYNWILLPLIYIIIKDGICRLKVHWQARADPTSRVDFKIARGATLSRRATTVTRKPTSGEVGR